MKASKISTCPSKLSQCLRNHSACNDIRFLTLFAVGLRETICQAILQNEYKQANRFYVAQTNTTFYLLNFLQSAMTLLKILREKLTRVSKICRSGSVMRTFLCIGVNQSVESPVTPYLSSVQRVLTSHVLFSGHHIAWSDQSFDSASTRMPANNRVVTNLWI